MVKLIVTTEAFRAMERLTDSTVDPDSIILFDDGTCESDISRNTYRSLMRIKKENETMSECVLRMVNYLEKLKRN